MKQVVRLTLAVCLSSVMMFCSTPRKSVAGVRLKDVCTVLGQGEIHLTGLGLVTGLQGTGDNKFNPTIRALHTALGSLNDRDLRKNAIDIKGLLGTKNIALVTIHAVVPAQGVKRGQKIHCMVTSIGSATSLRGGFLMATPLSDNQNQYAMGIASGALRIHEEESKTRGKIPAGVEMIQDFNTQVIHPIGDQQFFYLLIDPSRASFQTAAEVAELVNDNTRSEANSVGSSDVFQVARVLGEGMVEVIIPNVYKNYPFKFIAIVLAMTVENNSIDARVIVNKTTKTVVITGEVVISPVVLTHKGLQIAVGDGTGRPIDDFVTLNEQREKRDGQTTTSQEERKLEELLGAMKQLKLPADDIIDVVLNLEKAGVLHARVFFED